MTISNHKLSCSVALVLICWTTLSAESVGQTKVQTNVGPEVFDAKQRQWLDFIEILLDAAEQRYQKANECYRRIRGFALDSYTEERVRTFIDDANNSPAIEEYKSNRPDWKQSMRQRFYDCFLSAPQFKEFMIGQMQLADSELVAIDNATLVELGLDIDFKVGNTLPKVSDFAAFDRSIDEALELIIPDFEKAYAMQSDREGIADGVGVIAGVVADNAMSDENGNESWAATFGSLLLGVAVSQVSEAVLESTSTTDEDLHICVGLAASNVVLGCVDADRPAAKQWIAHVQELLRAHEVSIAHATIDELGIDRQWACDSYNDLHSQRAEGSNQ
jgi:hypothetical protein